MFVNLTGDQNLVTARVVSSISTCLLLWPILIAATTQTMVVAALLQQKFLSAIGK